MMRSLKLIGLFLCASVYHANAQNPNVVVKCSDTNTNWQLFSKNKVKTVTQYEVAKKGKAAKKLKAKAWYSPEGCIIKSFTHTPQNSAGGYYTETTAEYNTHSFRTKFEEYKYNKDSLPQLSYSESLVFDSSDRLKTKTVKQYSSKEDYELVTETYTYNEPGFEMVILQTSKKTNSEASAVRIYKYKSSASATPDFRDVTAYSKENSYTRSTSDNSTFDEYLAVENGKTTSHTKTIYEKDANGNLKKSIRKNLMSGKIMEETFHKSSHESETIVYNENGEKTNSYVTHLPYGLPPEPHIEIEGYSYPANVKRDTANQRNGYIKVTVYNKQYSNGVNEDVVSQTLEYNPARLLLKQDVLQMDTVTEYEYEYY